MRIDREYEQAIAQAKNNLEDLRERGADAVGGNVLEFLDGILTPEEIAESDLRVSIIGKSRGTPDFRKIVKMHIAF